MKHFKINVAKVIKFIVFTLLLNVVSPFKLKNNMFLDNSILSHLCFQHCMFIGVGEEVLSGNVFMVQLPSVSLSLSTVSFTLKLILFLSEITMLTSYEQDRYDSNKVHWTDHKDQSKVWNRFLDIPKKDDGSNSLISKEDSFRRKHKPRINSVGINENLQPASSVSNNLTNNVFQEIVNFVTATNNKFNLTSNQAMSHVDGSTYFADLLNLGLKGFKNNIPSSVDDNSINVFRFVSNSVLHAHENNPTNKGKDNYLNSEKLNAPDLQTSNNMEKAIVEQLKNNYTLQTLIAHFLNNTSGDVTQKAKLANKSNLYKKHQLNKKNQEIKNVELMMKPNELKKEPYLEKKHKTNLIADSYMLKKNRENITEGNKGHNLKTVGNSNSIAIAQKTRTSADDLLVGSTLGAQGAVTSSKRLTDADEIDDDNNEQTEQVVEVSTECVRFFHHIIYNISEDLNNNVSKNLEGGVNVKNVEDSKWTLTTKKTSPTTNSISSIFINKLITTTEYIKTDSSEETDSNDSFTKKPSLKKLDSNMIKVNTEPTFPHQSKTGLLGNGNEEKDMKLDHLNDKNLLLQILEGFNQILPAQDKTKDLSKNGYNEPEPVLKDLDKENVNDNVKDVLNDMLGIRQEGGEIIWKENEAALKMEPTPNKLYEKNGTELLVGVSTECVQIYQHNASEDLSTNINKNPEVSEKPFSSHNQSDKKVNITGESTSSNAENPNMLTDSNRSSNIKELFATTEQNIEKNTHSKIGFNDLRLSPGKLDSKLIKLNAEPISKDQPKVNISLFVKNVDDNELKDMGLSDHLNDQNLLLQILETLDPMSPPQDKTKENYNANDGTETGQKNLYRGNVDDNMKDALDDMLGIKQDG